MTNEYKKQKFEGKPWNQHFYISKILRNILLDAIKLFTIKPMQGVVLPSSYNKE